MTCLLKASDRWSHHRFASSPHMIRWKKPVKQRPRIFGKSTVFFSSTKTDLGPKSAEKKINKINPNQPRPHSQYHPFQYSSWMFTEKTRVFRGFLGPGTGVTRAADKNFQPYEFTLWQKVEDPHDLKEAWGREPFRPRPREKFPRQQKRYRYPKQRVLGP